MRKMEKEKRDLNHLDEGATATAAATLEDEQTTATPDAMIDCRPSRFQKCPLYAYLTTSCITR
jgi:hypothetical protein